MTDQWTHKAWAIIADYSCPSVAHTWSATAPDYDPDFDPETGRYTAVANTYVYAATYEELLMQIDEIVEESSA